MAEFTLETPPNPDGSTSSLRMKIILDPNGPPGSIILSVSPAENVCLFPKSTIIFNLKALARTFSSETGIQYDEQRGNEWATSEYEQRLGPNCPQTYNPDVPRTVLVAEAGNPLLGIASGSVMGLGEDGQVLFQTLYVEDGSSVTLEPGGGGGGGEHVEVVLSPEQQAALVAKGYAALRNSDGAIIGNQIGQLFGSQIGQLIGGDNTFARIGAGSVLGTVLGNLGQAAGIAIGKGLNLDTALAAAFDDFGVELGDSLRSSATGAVSAFLTAELTAALGLDGPGLDDRLFSEIAGTVVSTGVNNAVSLATALNSAETTATLAANAAAAGQPLTTLNAGALFQGLDTALNVGIAGFVGTTLAHEIVAPQTTAGSIGGSIGGTLGGAVGLALTGTTTGLGAVGGAILNTVGLSTLIGSLGTSVGVGAAAGASAGVVGAGAGASAGLVFGTALNFVVPVVGFFIGTLIGTLAGDALAPVIDDISDSWFGNDPPRADAWVQYDPRRGAFVSDPDGWQQAGGQRQAAVDLAAAARDTLNAFLGGVGGTVLNPGDLNMTLRIWEDRPYPFMYNDNGHATPTAALRDAVFDTLRDVRIAGGDMYVKRVLENTRAKTFEELSGDIAIAADYSLYVQSRDVIDSLIALTPDSAFAAGWVVTLARTQPWGLQRVVANDNETLVETAAA